MKIPSVVVHSLVSTSSVQENQSDFNLETVIDIARYGSKLKLLRITSLILKFIALLKSKNDDQSRELYGDELMAAEDKWVICLYRNRPSQKNIINYYVESQ